MVENSKDGEKCPICLSEFTEPVIISDGLTYDLGCLRPWYQVHRTSPLTKNLIAKRAYRNGTICQKYNIPFPENESFDLSLDVKWDSPKIEFNVEEETNDFENPIHYEYYGFEANDLSLQFWKTVAPQMAIYLFIFTFPTLVAVMGFWGAMCFYAIIVIFCLLYYLFFLR